MPYHKHVLDEIHGILQNHRFKAVGKVEAIEEVLYGPDGEFPDSWEAAESDLDEEDGEAFDEDEED